jgi:hypothetical protein
MFKYLVNYNFVPDTSWMGDDYLISDRSEINNYTADVPKDKLVKTENVGNADYDKLCYLVDNYDNLPDVFLWGKTNLFKYISEEEWNKVKDNTTYTPLLTKKHKTYSDTLGAVCFYAEDIYWERNDSWYLNQFPTKYFKDFGEFAHAFQLPNPQYIPFPPGGNFILTRDTVHKYSKDHYAKMASTLSYCQLPGEAQMCERAYYLMWK